jgi:hypothetical protein
MRDQNSLPCSSWITGRLRGPHGSELMFYMIRRLS